MNLQTTVATQNLTIHRDPKTFDNPDNFDPERWLKNGHDKLKEALTHSLLVHANALARSK